MSDHQSLADQLPDALPGYNVNFFIYRSGVTATISEIAYRQGRRRVVGTYRIGRPVDLPLGQGAMQDVAALCDLLAEWLSGEA